MTGVGLADESLRRLARSLGKYRRSRVLGLWRYLEDNSCRLRYFWHPTTSRRLSSSSYMKSRGLDNN